MRKWIDSTQKRKTVDNPTDNLMSGCDQLIMNDNNSLK